MQKDEVLLQKRLIELSRTAYQRGIVTFSDFLNLNEQHILHSIPKKELHLRYELFGGYEFSERQMVAFLPDALCYEYEYPISTIRISPLSQKFSETLNHRDYLGALLNLGIIRPVLGDILVGKEETVLFAQKKIAAYIIENLTKVKHTPVLASATDIQTFSYTPSYEVVKGSIASVRLDALLALAFSSSRSKMVPLIEAGKVFVNGKMITSNGYQIKERDLISVRGFGRFTYIGQLSRTKKDRCYIELHKYI